MHGILVFIASYWEEGGRIASPLFLLPVTYVMDKKFTWTGTR